MLSAFAGLLAENPTRGHGWRFLEYRPPHGARAADAGAAARRRRDAPYPDDACLEVLLQVADSSTTYRSRYLTAIRTRYVLELLLIDESNPRSVAYQVAALLERVHDLPQHEASDATPPGTCAGVATRGARARRQHRRVQAARRERRRLALEAHLQTIRNGVTDLSDALTARYLSHSAPSRLRRRSETYEAGQ